MLRARKQGFTSEKHRLQKCLVGVKVVPRMFSSYSLSGSKNLSHSPVSLCCCRCALAV